MKDQRWYGDYETTSQEFAYSKREEQMGMNDANMSHENDQLALGMKALFDRYELGELESSITTQLDTVGMQPHAREYLERESTGMRSARKLMMIDGQVIDHCDGIQFSGMP